MLRFIKQRGRATYMVTVAVVMSVLALAGGYAYADDATGASADQIEYALPLPQDALSRDDYAQPHHDYPASDLPVPTGTEAYASVAGQAEVFSDASCGNGVQIVGADQAVYVYCHFDRHAIQSGPVEVGALLGYTGSTGNSTGPHLHYQMRFADQLRCPQDQLLAIYDGVPPPAPAELPTSGCSFRGDANATPMGPE